MTGDVKGAIEDFAFYVEWLKETGEYRPGENSREAWIAELDAGRNPFDEAIQEALRRE